MQNSEEHAVLEFLRQETSQGHFESTIGEIARGINLSYNRVARVLERLTVKNAVHYRERGTERKAVRYYCLREVVDLCRSKWGNGK
jgi:predicted transcriptional regulator